MTAAGSISLVVERFAPTRTRPDGITGIIALDPDGGGWRTVVELEPRPQQLCLSCCGRRLVFLAGGEHTRLCLIDAASAPRPEVIAHLRGHAAIAMSASGEEFFASLRGSEARESGQAGVWRIVARRPGRERLPLGEVWLHDTSPDGRRLLVDDGGLVLTSLDGRDRCVLNRDGERPIRARFAPDARRIVFALATPDGESLWVLHLESRDRHLVLPESPVTVVARWSPDGTRLALRLADCVRGPRGAMIVPPDEASRRRPRFEVMDVDGRNRRPLNVPPGFAYLGDWR